MALDDAFPNDDSALGARQRLIWLQGWRTANLLVGPVAALLLSFRYYPGAFYHDVIFQFNWAADIAVSLWSLDPALPRDFSSWWPIWNSLYRVPMLLLTGEPGFTLFVTLVAFFWALRAFLLELEGTGIAYVVAVLVCAASPFAAWLVLHGPHTPVAACLLAALVAYRRNRPVLLALCLVTATLLRPETALFGMFLAGLGLMVRSLNWRSAVLVAAGLLIAVPLATIPHETPNSRLFGRSANDGLAVYTLTMMTRDTEELVPVAPEVLTFFNNTSGTFNLSCSLSMWCPPVQAAINWDKLRRHHPNPSGLLVRANLQYLATSPRLYLTTYFRRLGLAFRRPLDVNELGRVDTLHQARDPVIRGYMTANNAALVKRHATLYASIPWVYAPAALFGILLAGAMTARGRPFLAPVLALLAAYTLKVVVLPTQEVRYYFPEVVLALAAFAAMIVAGGHALVRRISPSPVRGNP